MIDPTHPDAGGKGSGLARLLPLLLFALLTVAGALWVVSEPAAAQENPAAPGQTLPPPEGTPLFFPLALGQPEPGVTPEPTRVFDSVPVEAGSLGWPAPASPDVNLLHRGFTLTTAYLGLVQAVQRGEPGSRELARLLASWHQARGESDLARRARELWSPARGDSQKP